jgi:hypothetical protein
VSQRETDRRFALSYDSYSNSLRIEMRREERLPPLRSLDAGTYAETFTQ